MTEAEPTPGGVPPAVLAIQERLDRLRDGEYTGRDAEGLATITVDGRGKVAGLELAVAVQRCGPDEVAAAVKAAYEEAERARADALLALGEELSESTSESTEEGAS